MYTYAIKNSFSKLPIALLFSLSLSAYATTLPISKILTPQAQQIAPNDGWASINNGTTGGANATADHIYLVNNRSELIVALQQSPNDAKIIQIKGIIDISDNQPYTSFEDQKARSLINIPSNTTLIGVTNDTGFINGSLILNGVKNIIIRNISIQAPIDIAPHFEEGDGWNAEWDAMNIISSTHIWLDHLTLSDGEFTDDKYIEKDGWKYIQHDGLLDIKRGSDLITLSYSMLSEHDKSMLFGHSDKNAAQDEGKLRITLHHNVFSNNGQRTPRIRFGKVHIYNNLFEGDTNPQNTPYVYLYSLGLGYQGSIISEHNQFNIQGADDHCHLVLKLKGDNIIDNGSQFNGTTVDWSQCGFKFKCQLEAALPLSIRTC